MLFVVSIRVRGGRMGLHSKRRSPSLCPFTHILRPSSPQIVLGLTEPSGRTLTVGALRRYWRNECFIPSPEGLLLHNPEGLKVARFLWRAPLHIKETDFRRKESSRLVRRSFSGGGRDPMKVDDMSPQFSSERC